MKRILFFLFFLFFIPVFSQNKNQSIGFKENKGQIIDQKGKSNSSVLYLLNSNGLNVQLKKNGFSYDVYEVKKTPVTQPNDPRNERENASHFQNKKNEQETNFKLEYIFHRIDIDFVNSNSKVELIAEQKSSDFDNYYNVPSKPEGVTAVYQFKKVTYKNIYPNIDAVFTIPADPQKTVEYNFVIHPKGKISDIQLKFNGVETDLVDNKIQMNVRFGKMEETLPASWIEDRGSKKEIEVGYRKIKKNIYGFSSSNSIDGKTIVIDPVPIRLWGTYYAGNNSEYSTDICNDLKNNVYFSGYTWSTTNIATTGSYIQYYYAHFYGNGFVAKFNTDGVRVWGIYYAAVPTAIKVDTNENLYFTGSVNVGSDINNSLIATPGSHQPESKGYYFNAFLVKLNSSGNREWSTFYGGDYMDIAYDIAIDAQNNTYLVGQAMSSTNIASTNAHQPKHADDYYGDDGFIAKFTPQGVRVWGTYFGGERDERILSANISDDGFLYVTGRTSSTGGISTTNSLVGFVSGMISKFNLDGQQIWGRYFNGSTFSLIDKSTLKGQFLYFIGTTNDHNNLKSTNTFNESFMDLPMNFGTSSYIAKFDVNTQNLVWGTYFGEIIQDIAINSKDKIIIEGCTSLKSGIATADAYSTAPQYGDAYMIKLNENGQREWGTYYGGNASEGINGAADVNNKISLDLLDNIYLIGNTQSSSGISTPGAHQENYSLNSVGGLYNVYLAKFQDCLSNPIASSNSPVCIGKTLELKASGGTNYSWTGPNGFTSIDQNPTIPNATASNSGEYSCLITGTGGCDDTKKINVVIGDIEKPIPDLTTLPTITGDCNTTVTTIPTANDVCAGVINATTTSPLSYALPGTYTIVWNYNDGNGNSATQNQTVIIVSQPLPTANSPQSFCVQQNATLNDIQITGQNIKWYSNLTNGTIVSSSTVAQDKTTYYASQTINGCESSRIPVTINIQVTSVPTANANQSFCTSQNPKISSIQITGTLVKWYDALTNGSLLAETTNLVNGKTYYASQTVNNCEGPRFGITVSVINTPSAPTANATQSFCKNENATLNTIQISGQNIKWFDTNMSAAPLPNTTPLENNRTYYASQTIGCESDRTPILVQIYDTPLPTGSNAQQFCIDENATISAINIQGTNIKWYTAQTAGTLLANTTLLQNGTYYATQTSNNCESERFAVNVKIHDTQNPIADSPQTFCIQQKAKISDINISGENIKWFESPTSTISLSESTLLENGITYYASEIANNCESDRIPIVATILDATAGNCINLVDELPFPKFFTPNGDGYNDYWTIDFAYLAPNTGVRIYNRYGKFIKELNNNSVWDGNYLGQQQPASDYWFIVTRVNGQEFKDHFSLKR
ncbi:gliding motility-associated C-terminal domain-containing protein [Flavobacterium resistens]|uniref:Gliding motility-associated C-terminal domain-containing protein n=1 Tax=Flavobacterium resistens TaxID=443612 RepID=A0A521DSQ1_9FLAO|nr:T9SS type B sorting domain-containing protein [Flavobacterium resistens]MRX68203.1 T9SS type B sorting domain-containing protein [Flavobacterium resistens]SMO74724.1 gliding motility-associated C-terminal domain-containing protein [Flavobacterium resistens]